jgi:hypothetical protein
MKAGRTQPSENQNNIGGNNSYSLASIEGFALGDPESTRKILISLVSSTVQNMALFRQSLEINDYKSMTELAHKMLPMFRLLEADQIVGPLTELEQNGFDKIDADMQAIGRKVLPEIGKLVEAIKADQQIDID